MSHVFWLFHISHPEQLIRVVIIYFPSTITFFPVMEDFLLWYHPTTTRRLGPQYIAAKYRQYCGGDVFMFCSADTNVLKYDREYRNTIYIICPVNKSFCKTLSSTLYVEID